MPYCVVLSAHCPFSWLRHCVAVRCATACFDVFRHQLASRWHTFLFLRDSVAWLPVAARSALALLLIVAISHVFCCIGYAFLVCAAFLSRSGSSRRSVVVCCPGRALHCRVPALALWRFALSCFAFYRAFRSIQKGQRPAATATPPTMRRSPVLPLSRPASRVRLPAGWSCTEHQLKIGRKIPTSHGPLGERARSMAHAWRMFHAASTSSSASFSTFSGVRAWRASASAAAASASASAVPESWSSTQCSNPFCTVISNNGNHAGICIFPPPPPRRRSTPSS